MNEKKRESKKAFRCDQCEAAMINGVFCHEAGCPNRYKVYDAEEERWVTPSRDEDESEYE
jgi:hypothetical protein